MWKYLREELGWAGPALLAGLGVASAFAAFGLLIGIISGAVTFQIVLGEQQALWAAVAVAVLVPGGIETLKWLRERSQSRQKVKAIGFAVYPALLFLEVAIQSLPQSSLALKVHARIWQLGHGKKLEIEIPDSIRTHLTDFYLMGDLGHELLQLNAVIEQFNIISKRAEEEVGRWEALAGPVQLMTEQICNVMCEIKKIHP